MSITNNPIPFGSAAIDDFISSANRCHNASKAQAAEAAAHAYLLWRCTLAPGAHESMRNSLEGMIAKRNAEIKNANAGLEALALTTMERRERHRLAIEESSKANPFTRFCKFVFGFDRRSHASLVSRYSKVLLWVDDKMHSKVIGSAQEIADEIEAAGGFEAVLMIQRGGSTDKPMATPSGVIRAMADELTARCKAAVESAEAIDVIDLDVDGEETFVALLGRRRDGRVEVVGETMVSDSALADWAGRFSDGLALPVEGRVAFLARVLALGKIVDEGRQTDLTQDDLPSGRRLREERVLTLHTLGDGEHELVISASRAHASTVIKARPKRECVDLGLPMQAMMLAREQLAKLERDFERAEYLTLFSTAVSGGDDDLAPFVWSLTNAALSSTSGTTDTERMTWSALGACKPCDLPLDIDGFAPRVRAVISKAELLKLFAERLHAWAGEEKGPPKLANLTFGPKALTFTATNQEKLELTLASSNGKESRLQFRPRDLHGLVLELKGWPGVDVFELAADERGMLAVYWYDDMGSYTAYLPTASNTGELIYTRLAPMQVQSAAEALAA